MSGQKLNIQFLKRQHLSNIQNENYKRNNGSCICFMGTAHFSHYIFNHFYPINVLLADTRTKGAGYFYKNCEDMDECVADSCWMPYKNKRPKKFYTWRNIYYYLQS